MSRPFGNSTESRSRPRRRRRATSASASARDPAPMSMWRSASSSFGASPRFSGEMRLRAIAPGTRAPLCVKNSMRCPLSVSGEIPPSVVNDEQAVLLDVRDRDTDLVDVPDERERRAVARPTPARARTTCRACPTSPRRTPRRHRARSGPAPPRARTGPAPSRSASKRSGACIRLRIQAGVPSRSRLDRHRPRHAARGLPPAARTRARVVPARIGRPGPPRPPLVRRLRHAARLPRRGGDGRSAGGRLPRLRPHREARADRAAARRRPREPAGEPFRRRRRLPRASTTSPARQTSSTATVTRSPPLLARPVDVADEPNAGRRCNDAHPRPGRARAARPHRPGATSAAAMRSRSCSRSGRSGPTSASPLAIYRALRRINPSPYLFLLELGDLALVGSSPETHVKVEGRRASLNPIAGTTARGPGDAERLLASEKDRAEHVMLVDLGRNDLSRVCIPGTVKVERFLEPERFSHVTHLVSEVAGELQDGVTPFDVLRATFPAGTVSGAPEGARHADHLGARGLPARHLRGRRRLPRAGARARHVHRDPHRAAARRTRVPAGGRRHRRRLRSRPTSTTSA